MIFFFSSRNPQGICGQNQVGTQQGEMLWLKWVSGIPDGFPQVLESGVALMISYVTFRRHTYFPGVVLSSSLGLSKLSPQTSLQAQGFSARVWNSCSWEDYIPVCGSSQLNSRMHKRTGEISSLICENFGWVLWAWSRQSWSHSFVHGSVTVISTCDLSAVQEWVPPGTFISFF